MKRPMGAQPRSSCVYASKRAAFGTCGAQMPSSVWCCWNSCSVGGLAPASLLSKWEEKCIFTVERTQDGLCPGCLNGKSKCNSWWTVVPGPVVQFYWKPGGRNFYKWVFLKLRYWCSCRIIHRSQFLNAAQTRLDENIWMMIMWTHLPTYKLLGQT